MADMKGSSVINLGKVSFTPRGKWSADVQYEFLDVVEHNGSGYIVRQSCKGIEPTDSDQINYMLIVKKGSDSQNLTASNEIPEVAADIGSAGSSNEYARADHVHPVQGTVAHANDSDHATSADSADHATIAGYAETAGTADQLTEAHKIGNADFDGSEDISLEDMGVLSIEEVRSEINSKLTSVYKPAGTIDELTEDLLDADHEGKVYNLSKAFAIDENFVEHGIVRNPLSGNDKFFDLFGIAPDTNKITVDTDFSSVGLTGSITSETTIDEAIEIFNKRVKNVIFSYDPQLGQIITVTKNNEPTPVDFLVNGESLKYKYRPATYPAGTNVVIINTDDGYKFDVLTSFINLSPYATNDSVKKSIGTIFNPNKVYTLSSVYLSDEYAGKIFKVVKSFTPTEDFLEAINIGSYGDGEAKIAEKFNITKKYLTLKTDGARISIPLGADETIKSAAEYIDQLISFNDFSCHYNELFDMIVVLDVDGNPAPYQLYESSDGDTDLTLLDFEYKGVPTYPAGTCVAVVKDGNDYKFSPLGGCFNLSAYTTYATTQEINNKILSVFDPINTIDELDQKYLVAKYVGKIFKVAKSFIATEDFVEANKLVVSGSIDDLAIDRFGMDNEGYITFNTLSTGAGFAVDNSMTMQDVVDKITSLINRIDKSTAYYSTLFNQIFIRDRNGKQVPYHVAIGTNHDDLEPQDGNYYIPEYPAGTCVAVVKDGNDYKFSPLGGYFDASEYVTIQEIDETYSKIPTARSITLRSDAWNSDSQTVNVKDVLANETKQMISWVPKNTDMDACEKAGIKCIRQGDGTLTFKCTTTPTTDITVYVSITAVNFQS